MNAARLIRKQVGFTVIEVALTLGLLTSILAIATVNLGVIQNKTYLAASVNTVISDIKLSR